MRFAGVNLGEFAQDLSLTAMVDLQCTEAGVLKLAVLPRSATGAHGYDSKMMFHPRSPLFVTAEAVGGLISSLWSKTT